MHPRFRGYPISYRGASRRNRDQYFTVYKANKHLVSATLTCCRLKSPDASESRRPGAAARAFALMNTRGAASGSEKITINVNVVKHRRCPNATAKDEKETRAKPRDAAQKKKTATTIIGYEKRRRDEAKDEEEGRRGRKGGSQGEGGWGRRDRRRDAQSSRSFTMYSALQFSADAKTCCCVF
ncbi:hypothetical protein PUN28_005872 [Cardiocondyla obscurior]|uniref:Uncharacterized protein n=1 Tax=Cardiocondyla obscurior TaxID=286306 RepID=A0AAW2G9N6_9HYME